MTDNNLEQQNLKILTKDFYLEEIDNNLEKILIRLNKLDTLTDNYFTITQLLKDMKIDNKIIIQKLEN